MTEGVDRHCVYVESFQTVILFRPGIAVIGGSKHPAAFTEYGIGSGKNVAVVGTDRQRSDVGRGETVIGQLPTLSIIR